MYKNPGSFRDPAGVVVHLGNRVFRTVSQYGADNYEYIRTTGLFDELVNNNLLVPFHELDTDVFESEFNNEIRHILELKKLNFISYPYEWPFTVLQEAALTHLKVHLKALEKGITLTDATAYNIQFSGSKALFIDHLSFRRYVDGELWYGHQQFCNQFLNPLLLGSLCGISYNRWYRASMEGITAIELNKVIPWYRKISLNVFLHVTMQSFLQNKYHDVKPAKALSKKLPLTAFRNMLLQFYDWIESLKAPASETSTWRNYTNTSTYQSEEITAKKAFISKYIENEKPQVVWDLGCNTGEFSKVCLKSGANLVIGFDADVDVLDIAYMNARKNNLAFLPLYMDITNPSPSQGWRETERAGLHSRSKPDGILALALVHHLVISKNIPLSQVIDWLIDIAPSGVVEFVPKTDPMVQKLLTYKEDIHPDYTEQKFISYISSRVNILQEITLTEEGRKLFWYGRN